MAVLQMQKISICALKKDRKAVLEKLQRMKVMEISQILEIPESTVRTRLARGRERLAQICGETKKSRKDGQCEIRMMERTRTV